MIGQGAGLGLNCRIIVGGVGLKGGGKVKPGEGSVGAFGKKRRGCL